ncbi:hypothetical protein HanIR_Chr11g0546661 [Helianthus annuus]|nr:hypothetical protein HanIR_Chr11g0546661 [Helianthus annuus]
MLLRTSTSNGKLKSFQGGYVNMVSFQKNVYITICVYIYVCIFLYTNVFIFIFSYYLCSNNKPLQMPSYGWVPEPVPKPKHSIPEPQKSS